MSTDCVYRVALEGEKEEGPSRPDSWVTVLTLGHGSGHF